MQGNDIVLVYMTATDEDEALKIGRALVEKKLAACINAWKGMRSIYRWEGKVEEASEAVLIAKTTAGQVEALTRFVKALHSYSVPCVLALPVGKGNPEYLKWLGESVG